MDQSAMSRRNGPISDEPPKWTNQRWAGCVRTFFLFGKSILKMGNGRILKKVFSKRKSSIPAVKMDQSAISKGCTYFLSFFGKSILKKGNSRILRKVFSKRKSSIQAIELILILAIGY